MKSHPSADLTLRRAELPAALRRPADGRDSDAIPRVGVTLAAVERFQREVARARGARRPWLLCFSATTRGLTTEAVNKLAMAHLTGARRCAYASLLDAVDASLVGEATVFVSHAWAMSFDALVATLRDFDREQRAREPARTPCFWLDLLVNDQFVAPSRPFEWWQTVFRENVRRIGHMLVVLEWERPLPLKHFWRIERPLPLQRVWCIWEMFCAASAVAEAKEAEARDGGMAADGVPPRRVPLLELALPPASREAFERVLASAFGSLAAKLCRIDLRDADAFHGGSGPGSCGRLPGGCPAVAAGKPCPNDKAQILGAIERAPGSIDGVTKVVVGALREWMVGGARRSLAAEPDADKRAGSHLQFSLARFLKEDCSRLAEAELLYHETARVWRRTRCGLEAEGMLVGICEHAQVLMELGKLDEAVLLMRETLDGKRHLHDEPCFLSCITWDALNNLGTLLYERGELDRAGEMFREALAEGRRDFGDVHPRTLTSVHNFGMLLKSRGDLDGAEKLLREALEARRRTLGDAHPDTLASMSSLGALLYERGNFAEAAMLLREALAGRRLVLGDAHEDTVESASWTAGTLRALASAAGVAAADAAPLLREALAAQRLHTGADSTLALEWVRHLADLLVSLGDAASVAEAALLADEALAGLRRNLGEALAATLIALRVRGRVLAAQGDLAGAAAALRASLDGLLATGENNGEARKSARELAAVLRALGDEAGAAAQEDGDGMGAAPQGDGDGLGAAAPAA